MFSGAKAENGCLTGIIIACRYNLILSNRSFSAYHTQYSYIPVFHHSMWLPNLDGHKKRHISKDL